jgi:hypothetical protein
VCQEHEDFSKILVLLDMNDYGYVTRFDCTAACDGVTTTSDHDMMTLWFFFNLGSCTITMIMSNYEGIEISFC